MFFCCLAVVLCFGDVLPMYHGGVPENSPVALLGVSPPSWAVIQP